MDGESRAVDLRRERRVCTSDPVLPPQMRIVTEESSGGVTFNTKPPPAGGFECQ